MAGIFGLSIHEEFAVAHRMEHVPAAEAEGHAADASELLSCFFEGELAVGAVFEFNCVIHSSSGRSSGVASRHSIGRFFFDIREGGFCAGSRNRLW